MTTDPTHQPTLPGVNDLPDYHGTPAVGMRTGLAGAGNRIQRAHSIGDRVVLVIEARVKSAGHKATDDGILYVEGLTVADLFELPGDQGARLLATMRSLHRNDATGTAPVPELADVGYTDASGVVLTPEELAELRGDPIRAILSPELTPAVVVYEDGSRDLWPDDYPKDTPRPKPGERWTTDRGELVVEQLVHHETGEPFETVADAAPPKLAAVPDLPPESDEWETADRRTPEEIAAEAELPTAAHLDAVNVPLTELGAVLAAATDLAELRRLLKAEQQGRGIAAKPRPKAVAMIEAAIAKASEVTE